MRRQPAVVLVFVIVSALTLSASAEPLFYELDVGSTITPLSGETEILTGTFQWELELIYTDAVAFNATELFFQSKSFTFTLNKTPYNNVMSSLFTNGSCNFFEVVDATGLPLETVELGSYSDDGYYTGPIDCPTHLVFPDVKIVNHSGGPFIGRIDMTATLVPEPSTIFLLSFGVVLLRKRR